MKVRISSLNLTTRCFTENGDGKMIDWNNSSDRKWLMSHLHWAMNNNVSVQLIPESN